MFKLSGFCLKLERGLTQHICRNCASLSLVLSSGGELLDRSCDAGNSAEIL
jgi:hypothetical protein